MVNRPKTIDRKVTMAPAYQALKRTMRRPQYPFQLRTRPFQLQPFMIAPVLPGETLQNLLLQARSVTDPIVHPLIGWWNEYYFFYVKHRDIEFHADHTRFQEMVLDPAANLTDMHSAADVKTYHAYGINWLQECLELLTEWYFRDDGEVYNNALLDGLPLVQYSGRNWTDSLTLNDDKRVDRRVNLDLDADGSIQADEVDDAVAHWQALRDAGLVAMDYEDFLSTYGVKGTREDSKEDPELHKPELVRYSRQWSYPANTVDPATGEPSSAVMWSTAERADKKRFFKEPGFLVGLTVARPKVYLKNQKGSLTGSMDNVMTWLPAIVQHQYEKGFRGFDRLEGPLTGLFPDDTTATEYWVDIRDLFMYGEQFVNFAPAADANMSGLALPTAGNQKRYASATEIDALFKGANKAIRTDGVVSLGISGRQKDMTPATTL